MSHVTRKPVFGICDQVRLKRASSALEILDLGNICITLYRHLAKAGFAMTWFKFVSHSTIDEKQYLII